MPDDGKKLKQKDHQIEVLEKAVESQLDKVDELEEELRKVYEDVFVLEGRIADLTGLQQDSEGGGSEIQTNSQRRLTELKSKKEENLESRSQHLKEETDRILSATQPRDVNDLQKENETLRKALQKKKDGAELIVVAKDQKIHDLSEDYPNREDSRTDESLRDRFSSQMDKSEEISSMRLEIQRLKEALRDQKSLETSDDEVQVMKARWEGAQRRNLILEEDIEHWKNVNCSLEEELDETKAQGAMWKAKYLTAACAANASSSIGRGSGSGMRSAADISMMRKDEDADKNNIDESQSSIASFWSKLTKSNSARSMNQSFHSANSREDSAGKTIF